MRASLCRLAYKAKHSKSKAPTSAFLGRPTPIPPPAPEPAPPPSPFVPEIVWENRSALVINKEGNTAIQGQHGSTGRRRWDVLLEGELSRSFSVAAGRIIDLGAHLQS